MRGILRTALLTLVLIAAPLAAQELRLVEVDAPEGGERDEFVLETILLLPDRTLVTLRFIEEMCGGLVLDQPGSEHGFRIRDAKGTWRADIRAVAGVLSFGQPLDCVPEGSRLVLDFPPVPANVTAVDITEGEGGTQNDLRLWSWRRIALR